MKKIASRVIIVVLIALCCLSVYEYILLRLAQGKTEALFKPYSATSFNGLQWHNLTKEQQSALITVEDPEFFSHKGIDFITKGAGITTITQAIVKRLYFKPFTPGFQKIEQSLIARYAVTPAITKEVQLTTFLNVAYFGHVDGREVKGFADAAHTYFHKPVQLLSQEEYLSLVAMLISPNELKPGTEKSLKRMARIKKLIAGHCEAQSLSDVYFEACD